MSKKKVKSIVDAIEAYGEKKGLFESKNRTFKTHTGRRKKDMSKGEVLVSPISEKKRRNKSKPGQTSLKTLGKPCYEKREKRGGRLFGRRCTTKPQRKEILHRDDLS